MTSPSPSGPPINPYPTPQPEPAAVTDPTQPVPDPLNPPKGDDGPAGET